MGLRAGFSDHGGHDQGCAGEKRVDVGDDSWLLLLPGGYEQKPYILTKNMLKCVSEHDAVNRLKEMHARNFRFMVQNAKVRLEELLDRRK